MARTFVRRGEGGAQAGAETYPQQLKRVGTATGIKSLETPENLQNLLMGLVGGAPNVDTAEEQYLPEGTKRRTPAKPQLTTNEQFITGPIKKKYGITEEQLKPQGTVENFVQRAGAGAIPALLTGGLAGLGTSTLGSAAAAGAGHYGAPEGLQDVIQLVTEYASGRVVPSLKETKAAKYALAKVPEELRLAASPVETGIGSVLKSLKQETDTGVTKKIKGAIRVIEDNITKKNLNPNDAKRLRQTLYEMGKDFTEAQRVEYFNPLTQGINDFFDLHAATTPEFYKNLKYADKLHAIDKIKTKLPQLLGETFKLYKIPGAESLIQSTLGNLERFTRSLKTNSAATKYLFDTTKSVLKNDPYATIKNLKKLNEYLPGASQQQETGKRRFVRRQQ